MANRIENLGDYNQMRMDLQLFGGDLDALYNCVGEIFVEKAKPKHFLMGAVLGIAGIKLLETGKKYLIERRKLLRKEPEIKKAFTEVVVPVVVENEENANSGELKES